MGLFDFLQPKKTAIEYLQSGISKKNSLDYDGALQDFIKATELDHNCIKAYLNKGIIHTELKNYILALTNFDIVIDLDINNIDAYYQGGNIKVILEDYHGAIDYNTAAIYMNPSYIEAYINRAFSKSQLLDWRGAIVDYTKIIELNPNYSDAYFNRGVAKHSLREYKDAIDDLSIAIKLNPNDKVAYELIEKSTRLIELEKLMNLQSNNINISAEDDFNKSIELNPTFKTKLDEEIEKKSCFDENNQNSIEVEWLQSTESIYYDNGYTELQLDTLYTDDRLSVFLNTETTKNANAIIESLININGGFSNFKTEIRNGYELFYVGNKFSISWRYSLVGLIQVDIISRESEDFDEFNTMNIEFDAYYYNIAKANFLNDEAYCINYFNGDYQEGIDSVKIAIELIPDDSNFFDTLAVGYYYLGDYKLAIETSDKCIELGNINNFLNSEHYTNRAKINLKLNNKENAIKDLKIALELNPDFEEAIQLLESLGNN